MDKLAVGPGYPPDGVIDLAKSPTENVKAVAKAKGVEPSQIIVCVLDRPRHADLIAELRGLGCGIQLIPDGDVAGVIAVTDEDTTIDHLHGFGGCAPEGVLAAAAHCAALAASSRAGCCSATMMSVAGPGNGGSKTSTASIRWMILPWAIASLQRPE